jgi:hypothetical protein
MRSRSVCVSISIPRFIGGSSFVRSARGARLKIGGTTRFIGNFFGDGESRLIVVAFHTRRVERGGGAFETGLRRVEIGGKILALKRAVGSVALKRAVGSIALKRAVGSFSRVPRRIVSVRNTGTAVSSPG